MGEMGVAARLAETVAAVRARVSLAPPPRVGVVLGSGLGAFADGLGDLVKIPYTEIPHLPASRVVGHAGNLCFGRVDAVPVVCMQGRVHLYEGHPVWQVVHGARAMARLGVSCVLVTNAAGGLAPSFCAGDLMVVTDHLNLMHQHPLVGPNEEVLGTRFPDMTNAYDATLRAQLAEVGARERIELREGVYAGLLGPSYETPAEIRMLTIWRRRQPLRDGGRVRGADDEVRRAEMTKVASSPGAVGTMGICSAQLHRASREAGPVDA
jgi:purine-nucleoside phosphorylase